MRQLDILPGHAGAKPVWQLAGEFAPGGPPRPTSDSRAPDLVALPAQRAPR